VTLSAADISALRRAARQVGGEIGCDLRFEADDDPRRAGLTAGQTFVFGPVLLDDLRRSDVENLLRGLQSGRYRVDYRDGTPSLVSDTSRT
jgi:hypothetical protein